MNTTVDARGLSCPQPVMMVHKEIVEDKFPIEVMVDTVTSRENVRRMALSRGYKVEVIEHRGEFKLVITK